MFFISIRFNQPDPTVVSLEKVVNLLKGFEATYFGLRNRLSKVIRNQVMALDRF